MKRFLTIICALAISVSMSACTTKENKPKENKKEEAIKEEPKEDVRISFAAVGDDLIHGAIFISPDYIRGDSFDFTPMYSEVKEMISGYDLANINQETILGGKELGLSHYPCFNSPQEIGAALVDTGFDWISQASNHSLDKGVAGIESAMNFWDNYPNIITTGINRSPEEANRLRMTEIKGVKIGMMNYSYGFNGFVEPEDYYCNEIDRDKIAEEYKRLKKAGCEVVLASMHWGVEYQFASNAEQQDLAQYLADLGVNVIIGSHPHVIQETEYLTGKNGNQTLVNYSLGNFISCQDEAYNMLGALMSCDIVVDGDTREVRIEHAKVYPTVTYYEYYGGMWHNFKVYLLQNYTNDLAVNHGVPGTTVEYLNALCDQVYGEVKDIEIVR